MSSEQRVAVSFRSGAQRLGKRSCLDGLIDLAYSIEITIGAVRQNHCNAIRRRPPMA